MQTELDSCYEVQLDNLYYDGLVLTVNLSEQVVQKDGNIESDPEGRKFKLVAGNVTAHLVVEEFAAATANLVKSDDVGFLRKVENQELKRVVGLGVAEKYADIVCYALIASHEVLIIFSSEIPSVETLR